MEFTKPAIAAKFNINIPDDQEVLIPGQYKGKISGITNEDIITGMISRGSTLVEAKEEADVAS